MALDARALALRCAASSARDDPLAALPDVGRHAPALKARSSSSATAASAASIAEALRAAGVPCIVVEQNRERVESLRASRRRTPSGATPPSRWCWCRRTSRAPACSSSRRPTPSTCAASARPRSRCGRRSRSSPARPAPTPTTCCSRPASPASSSARARSRAAWRRTRSAAGAGPTRTDGAAEPGGPIGARCHAGQPRRRAKALELHTVRSS
ncbi:MAG: hypothetical protein MZW92_50400 [Comamonadaceae bacterium]|nr:hypothetical protein [Comamonadaceae bacterium]